VIEKGLCSKLRARELDLFVMRCHWFRGVADRRSHRDAIA
jgi:hypothetical protein